MLVNILILVLILLRLVIGIRLIILARQNNLPNVYWLAAQFFANAIGLLFAPVVNNPLANLSISLWMFILVGTLLSQVLILPFNHITFYRDKKSPLGLYLGAFLILSIISIYGVVNSESSYNQNQFVAAANIMAMLVWIWHGQSASQAFAGIAKEQSVEDWVKSRYQLILAYSIVLGIGAIGSFIRVVFAGGSAISPLGNAMALLTLVAQIIAIPMQFLVWVVPQGFRAWLNRNQQAHTEERHREQAEAILNILGSAMAEGGTGLSSMTALIAIRTMIGKEIKTEDSLKITEQAIAMGYNEWQALLKSHGLHNLLTGMGSKVDPGKAVDNAIRTLTEKQSLFTMQAK